MGPALPTKQITLYCFWCLRQKNENANILSVFILNISGPYAVISNTSTLQELLIVWKGDGNSGSEFSSKAHGSLEGHQLRCLYPVFLFSFLFPYTKPAPGFLSHCHTHVQCALSKRSSLSKGYDIEVDTDSW